MLESFTWTRSKKKDLCHLIRTVVMNLFNKLLFVLLIISNYISSRFHAIETSNLLFVQNER